jgi:hypothetical protein
MQMTVLGMAWANALTLLWDSGVFGSKSSHTMLVHWVARVTV